MSKKFTRAEKDQALETKLDRIVSSARKVQLEGMAKPCLIPTSVRLNSNGYGIIHPDGGYGFKSPTCAHLLILMVEQGMADKKDIPKDPTRKPYKQTGNGGPGKKVYPHLAADHICARAAKTHDERVMVRSCIEPTHLHFVTADVNQKLIPIEVIRAAAAHARTFAEGKGLPPRQADCHPDRRHYGRGLCNSCWKKLPHNKAVQSKRNKWRYKHDPVFAAKERAKKRDWYHRNKDRSKEPAVG